PRRPRKVDVVAQPGRVMTHQAVTIQAPEDPGGVDNPTSLLPRRRRRRHHLEVLPRAVVPGCGPVEDARRPARAHPQGAAIAGDAEGPDTAAGVDHLADLVVAGDGVDGALA